MSHSTSFAGIILAAGGSTRMGRDKALLPWPPLVEGRKTGSGTFLSAAIDELSSASDFVVVVASDNAETLAPIAYANGASLLVNPDPGRGQFSSLQIGLQEVLNHGRDTAIVTLVDRPPASAGTVQLLRQTYESAGNEVWAVVPEFGGKHGHPFIAGRQMIAAFLQAPATSSAREVEHQHQSHILYVVVDDPNIVLNINTPAEYAELPARSRY
jgi:molybdenum cofactor cytidylyltransferase